MKAILMSIKPQHVANILNGKKTIEIRKKFPSDYVGWVYIYCTKDSSNLLHKNCANIWWVEDKDFQKKNKRLGIEQQPIYNGKVVGRFWCDKVEEIETDYAPRDTFFKECCLTPMELFDYIGHSKWYAIHITEIEIFDEPKEISEFYFAKTDKLPRYLYPLTRAPQSYCFIEV